MRSILRSVVIAMAIMVVAGAVRAQEGWGRYEAEEYGFSMLLPTGTLFVERESRGGWGELYAEHEGVAIYVLAKLGEQATPEEIEQVGVQLTGIPSSAWDIVQEGENESGWNWYRTVEAVAGGKLIIGDYGTGRRGSYLVLLETTEADFEAYEDDYVTWYESIRLN